MTRIIVLFRDTQEKKSKLKATWKNMKFFNLKTQVKDKIVMNLQIHEKRIVYVEKFCGTWSQEGIFIEHTLADPYCGTQLHFHVALFHFIRAIFRITLVISCLNF